MYHVVVPDSRDPRRVLLDMPQVWCAACRPRGPGIRALRAATRSREPAQPFEAPRRGGRPCCCCAKALGHRFWQRVNPDRLHGRTCIVGWIGVYAGEKGVK